MAGNVAEITDAEFEEKVLKATTHVVVVDFWAPWCGPCKSIAPVLDEIAKELGDKVNVVKINVDDNPKSAAQYMVRAIPNLIIFKGGVVVDRMVGAVPKDQLVATIKKAI
jgi:thioredoxin 1